MSKSIVKSFSIIWVAGIVLVVMMVLFAMPARGETAPTATTAAPQVAAQAAGASEGKLMGFVETRPSYLSKAGAFKTENVVELGYQFGKAGSVSYLQAITTNLYDNRLPPGKGGLSPALDRGFLRTRLNNLIKSDLTGLSLSYENRLYVPTAGYDQVAGVNAIMRNYFKLKKVVSPSLDLHLMEIPIFQFNARAGNGTAALPVFQNRVYLQADIKFSDKLTLYLPLMFHQTKYGQYGTAANSGGWDFFVWTYPELDYAISDKVYVGVAFYSDNLIAPNFSGLTLGKGLENGVTQLVLGASL